MIKEVSESQFTISGVLIVVIFEPMIGFSINKTHLQGCIIQIISMNMWYRILRYTK